MKFTISLNQYNGIMRHYSPPDELNGKLALTGLLRDYNITFSKLHPAGGYEFEAMDPKLYTMFVLRFL